jgi:putative ABC transport system permease protein
MKSLVERIYPWILHIYPAEFREEYGAEMGQVFRELYTEQQQLGSVALMSWCVQTFLDLGVSAMHEHLLILWQDLSYGLRTLRKNFGFAIVAVLTLALGIGANTAIFSIVNAVLLRALPYESPERLVQVWENNPLQGLTEGSVSGPDFLDWRSQNQVFSNIALYQTSVFNLKNKTSPERVYGSIISAEFFDVMGVKPLLGRGFLPEEEKTESDQVVVLSNDFWQTRFAGQRDVIGKTMMIDARRYTIVGVMPPSFQFPRLENALWVPFAFNTKEMQERGSHSDQVVARLKPDVSFNQAANQMRVVAKNLERQYPDSNTGRGIKLVPLQDEIVGRVRSSLLLLSGAVFAILLIACANVANLLLSRSIFRQKEIAVRIALGASQRRILRQLLTESALLAAMGTTLGMLLAFGGVKLLVALSSDNLPRAEEISVDGTVFAFTLIIALLSTVLFGLAPAFQLANNDLNYALKDSGRSATGGKERNRLQNLLVVAEIALSLVLLISAGLLTQSFLKLQSVDPGFNPRQVLVASIALPEAKYNTDQTQITFFDQVIARLQSLPGVQSASVVSSLPLSGNFGDSGFVVEGQPAPKLGQEPDAGYLIIGSDYPRTMGIPLLRGRTFNARDDGKGQKVALINETMAHRYWPSIDPIGKRFSRDTPNPKPDSWITIIGIVKDIKHYDLAKPVRPEMYFPYAQNCYSYMTLVIRTSGSDPTLWSAGLRTEVQTVDPDQALGRIRTMDQVVSASIDQQRFNMLLLLSFSAVALGLSGIGIYGVMAYSVTQRTHEIGIRMALGATQGKILRLVVSQGMRLSIFGVVIGLGVAVAMTRILTSLLFGVSALEPVTFVSVSFLILAVALTACYLPARKATKVNPMIALKYD